MSTKCGPEIVTDGLVLALDAGNPRSYPGSGTTWYDLSGNGNNGTLINGPTYNNANKGSIVFDGSDDKVDCGNNFTITNELTLSSWIYSKSRITYHRILGVENIWIMMIDPRNQGGIGFYGSGVDAAFNDSPIIDLNKWYNVVITYNGNGLMLYVNGIYYSTISKTGSLNIIDSTKFSIGGRLIDNQRQFNGNISIPLCYNKSLSQQEILQNYNAHKSRFNL